ncbi:Vitamin B12 ABC transporter, B12-binding component BtuF [Thermococcus sp. 2319x1]|nr:Vitamin B12 ABC transporter, B12-binding component BtuF [Thermococcus sp. 2319x1]
MVNLRPDVIFTTYVDAKTAQDIQEKTGIPVVVLSYGQVTTAL